MSVKVLCPKMKVPWTAAAILCAVVLVALWITAWRVRAMKLEARQSGREPPAAVAAGKPRLKVAPDRKLSGTAARTLEDFFSESARDPKKEEVDVEIDPQSPPQRQWEVMQAAEKHGVPFRLVTGDTAIARIVLRRGERLRVEGFTLHFWERVENVSVYDAKGVHCVEYTRIRKDQRRGWQELQLTVLEVEKDQFTMEVEIRPGAPCFGGGFYRNLKPGLRIEFPGKRALSITAYDPRKPEIQAVIEGFEKKNEHVIVPGSERRDLTIYYRFWKPEGAADPLFLVDDLD